MKPSEMYPGFAWLEDQDNVAIGDFVRFDGLHSDRTPPIGNRDFDTMNGWHIFDFPFIGNRAKYARLAGREQCYIIRNMNGKTGQAGKRFIPRSIGSDNYALPLDLP